MLWLRRVSIAISVIFVLLGIAYFYLWHTPTPPKPKLSAQLQRAQIQVGDRERSYSYFAPTELPKQAPLLLIFHGSMQNGELMRVTTGYEFDRLADLHGFITVYPDGYDENWNTCRKIGNQSARILNIDDKGLTLALIERFRQDFDIDSKRVFAVGYSAGGQLAFRLAFELPQSIAGIATIGSNLPIEENCTCIKSGQPVPALILNGDADPINPFSGGEVTLFGFASRGPVLGSLASAEAIARMNQHDPSKACKSSHFNSAGTLLFERHDWQTPGQADVVHLRILGGGHTIPQPIARAPRLLGKTAMQINGPEEIWAFFAYQVPRRGFAP